MILPPSTGRGTGKALVSRLTRASLRGVSDGARTRDTQDHNLVLYQLSYTHHRSPRAHAPEEEPAQRYRSRSAVPHGRGSVLAHAVPAAPSGAVASPAASRVANESTTSSAAPFAWSLLGPGAGTKRVRR